MKVMTHESLTGEFDDKILVLKRRYVKVIMELIGELQAKEGTQGIDLRVAAFALFGMMNWIHTGYQPRDLPLPQLIEEMLRIYFFGVFQRGAGEALWFAAGAELADKAAFSLWQNHSQ